MKIKFCDELPQWITSSDIGAYHPFTKTIFIRKRLGYIKPFKVLIHEMVHYLIHVLHLLESCHNRLDGIKNI